MTTNNSSEADDLTNLQKIRDLLQDLTYSEMMTLAEWFANAEAPDNGDADASFWASVINDLANNIELAEDFE